MRPARCAATLLAAAVGFAVIQASLSLKVLGDPLLRRDDVWQRKLRRHRQRTAAEPVAFVVAQVGSSRTAVGLCGEEAEPVLRRRLGHPVVVLNFGQAGAGPITTLLEVRRLLDDGVRPDLLLVEVFPPLLAERTRHEEASSDRLPAAHLTAADLGLLSRHAYQERPWLAAEWLGAQVLPAASHRLALITEAAPSFLSVQKRRDRFRQMRPSGWLPVRPPPADAARARAVAMAEYAVWLRDYEPSPRLLAVVEETVELARSEGIRVALVLMPEGPAFRGLYPAGAWRETNAAIERIAQRQGVPLINLRECLDEGDFYDGHHPHPGGARRASREWAERLPE